MANDEQPIVLTCTSLVVFMLLHTQILCVPSNKINEINVYSNKLVNNLHIITIQTTQQTKLRVERVETNVSSVTSVSSRAFPTWQTTKKQKCLRVQV